MNQLKPIVLRGQPVAGGRMPIICTPLVGRTRDAVLEELANVLPKRPDILEWRADFFEGIGDTARVLDLARALKAAAGKTPVLFTCRSAKEGGQTVPLTEEGVVALLVAVCEGSGVDAVDYELANAASGRERVRAAARAHGVALVLSYHNFKATPPRSELQAKCVEAEAAGADVAKVAVMPNDLEDVLTLLGATLDASRRTAIPVITMSMGAYGSISRMVGGVFGSALTFAVGQSSSAPGQVPIEDLRAVLEVVRRSAGG